MVSKLENKQNLLKFNDASKQAKLSAMSEWLGYKPKVYTFGLYPNHSDIAESLACFDASLNFNKFCLFSNLLTIGSLLF